MTRWWAIWLALGAASARRVVPLVSSEARSSGAWPNAAGEEKYLNMSSNAADEEPLGRRLSEQERRVRNLPGLEPKSYPHRHWAGYIDVDKKHGGHLFYWLFESWEAPATAPLIVWMNGGPGCSSMDGLFLENGPFKLSGSLGVKVNPHSWAATANVVYLDQPVGTGLSYTTGKVYPKNDGDVNKGILDFFDGFFEVHPELAGRELFLTGESHSGHYLPSLAQAILLRGDKQAGQPGQPTKPNEVIRLGGVAIGNGWIDPRVQYDVSTFAHGMGLISAAQQRGLKVREKRCREQLDSGNYMWGGCWDLLDDVVRQSGAQVKVLMYDIRLYSQVDTGLGVCPWVGARKLQGAHTQLGVQRLLCPLIPANYSPSTLGGRRPRKHSRRTTSSWRSTSTGPRCGRRSTRANALWSSPSARTRRTTRSSTRTVSA